MERAPILRVDENYKHGLENGMQHAFLNMIESPLPDAESTCPSYAAGFQQGLQTAKRVLFSSSGGPRIGIGLTGEDQENFIKRNACGMHLNMNIGGEDSDNEEDEKIIDSPTRPRPELDTRPELGIGPELEPPSAFLEEKEGIPIEYFNPIEANSLEYSLLTESSHGLTLLHYLRNGYAVYLKWLKDKAHIAGLSSEWDDYLTFAVARDINRHANGSRPELGTDYPMGDDIEMTGFAHSMPESDKDQIYQYRTIDKPSFCYLNHDIGDICDALQKSPTMTTMDFYVRLKKVPEKILDRHSRTIWRGTEAIIKNGKLEISVEDLEMGVPISPSCGFHLGLRMLEKNGFISCSSIHKGSDREYHNSRSIVFTES